MESQDKPFSEKVKAMKVSEIIEAMVEGLEYFSNKKNFRVNMGSYGKAKYDICFGCAATCTIQKIGNVEFNSESIETRSLRVRALNKGPWSEAEWDFLNAFEHAINDLKDNDLKIFLQYLLRTGVITEVQYLDLIYRFGEYKLPMLIDGYWVFKLEAYKNLAKSIKEAGY